MIKSYTILLVLIGVLFRGAASQEISEVSKPENIECKAKDFAATYIS